MHLEVHAGIEVQKSIKYTNVHRCTKIYTEVQRNTNKYIEVHRST